ncbi:unnamed protein product [Urochloa decumbens]|uniref:F-box domain-containing protein n=1 Tax=Urochloa decumbens TaxID=240449 RepID=A0ABC9FPX1_9POAL
MESELQRNAKRSELHAHLTVTASDGLPLSKDLLFEVLLRLPAKVLCRFRLVCRSWRSLISDPIFVKAHSSRHPLVVGLRYVPMSGRGWRSRRRHDHQIQLLDPFSGNVLRRIRTRQSWRDHELSTHLGLLCISERGRAQEEATVLNPATGELLMLPTTGIVTKYKDKSMTWSTCVLGWVPSTGEYKVLRVCRYNDGPYLDGDRVQIYHVITVGRDASWRVKPCPPVQVAKEARAVINGVAYFLMDIDPARSNGVIAAFDLATEEWRHPMLRGPLNGHCIRAKDEDRRSSFDLTDLNGCLVSICRTWSYCFDKCSVDLWFLADVDKELWIKQYSLRYAPFGDLARIFTPLAILDDERILMWVQGAEELRAYDPRTSTWTNLSMIDNIFHIGMYQGSLLC